MAALKSGFAHSLGHPQGYVDRGQRPAGQAHAHTQVDELFDSPQ